LGFKNLRKKILKTKAKLKGMTVPEYHKYFMQQKAEKKKFKEELRRKEREEKQKHEKWKIEQKYKQKRKQVKTGKASGALGIIELLGGSQSKQANADPLGLFSSPVKKKKRKRRKKR